MILKGWNQLLGLSFCKGNPMITIAISTWFWLLNEENVKLSYFSFECNLHYPLKVSGRPHFLLGGGSNVSIWDISVWVCTHTVKLNISHILSSAVKLHKSIPEEFFLKFKVLSTSMPCSVHLSFSFLLISFSLFLPSCLSGPLWYQIRLKGYFV